MINKAAVERLNITVPETLKVKKKKLFSRGGITMLLGTMEQSLIFAIMVMGVYISFRILDFPDMTVDGSFPMGAAIVASCLVREETPVLALALACIGGAAAGFITGYIHVKFKIANILAGIIVMTGLYSINIKIMGRSNLSLFKEQHLFYNGNKAHNNNSCSSSNM